MRARGKGSLPVVKCTVASNSYRNGNARELWIMNCQYCLTQHFFHSSLEGTRVVGHVCRSEKGQQAFHYGLVITIEDVSEVSKDCQK